jgi:hypothetical protein
MINPEDELSLRVFHIVFIVLSILLMVGFGIWGVFQGDNLYLSLGIISFVIGILLIFYLMKIVRKFKQVNSMQE